MTFRSSTLALLAALLAASPALAQDSAPPFRGPQIHDGAWTTKHAWSDAFQGDPAQGSYAYAYRAWARQQADAWVEERLRLDCADLSIALLCEFAAENRLPVTWRVYYPAERRFVEFTNEDRQFDSPKSFRAWSQYYLGAMNLADNTYPVTYEDWAGGDMILMDWNQSDESPNFEGRVVWHTYLVGAPDEVVYYGNITGGNPLPVSRVTGGSRMEMVRSHPDRYGLSPRRFGLFRDAVWGPTRDVAEVIRARRLNLRQGPGTGHPVLEIAPRGATAEVIDRRGRWANLRLEDGREVWAHMAYLEIRREPIPAPTPEPAAEEPAAVVAAPAEEPATEEPAAVVAAPTEPAAAEAPAMVVPEPVAVVVPSPVAPEAEAEVEGAGVVGALGALGGE